MKYLPTIGLEVHAELRTNTKMFCGCQNNPDEKEPNKNTCPVCLGHPGVLPTINKKAVELIIKIGFAVDGEINKQFKFDRKNYFYPDLPKGYQISQFDKPIVKGGSVDIADRLGESKIVELNRVHLEEDAAKLVHSGSDSTLIDFNRGGVPLMELVTEPVIHSAKEAVAFAKELQLILRYLGVSDADLERGQMRVDANISLSADEKLGIRTEIKNLNSFRAIEGAINYEIERQAEVLDSGKKIKQETLGWDDIKNKTISQRSKEEAHDYRYFPEPDLPPMDQSGFDLTALKLEVPELPQVKRLRFKRQFKLFEEQINIIVEDRQEANYFEEAVSELEADASEEATGKKIQLLFNYLNSDLKGLMKERALGFDVIKITSENFADLAEMVFKNEINSRVAKDLLAKMADTGVDPRTIVENEGLGQISGEEALQEIAGRIIENNPAAVTDYKKGKLNALQFLVGKAMAELKGRGNPGVLKSLFEKLLK
ncbi:MAG: Asp-tRNA(Asn)/Glu-tRNA(Gln) amidotransferase subunit GatB [Patescibacteria group bacterium]